MLDEMLRFGFFCRSESFKKQGTPSMPRSNVILTLLQGGSQNRPLVGWENPICRHLGLRGLGFRYLP